MDVLRPGEERGRNHGSSHAQTDVRTYVVLRRSKDVMTALSVMRQTYLDLWRNEDVLTALSVIRQIYLDLKRNEDVRVALSLLEQTYLHLKRSEDVMTALSVLLRWMYSDLGRSEGILMALLTQLWTGTTSPGFLFHEAAWVLHCLRPPVYLSMPVTLDPTKNGRQQLRPTTQWGANIPHHWTPHAQP